MEWILLAVVIALAFSGKGGAPGTPGAPGGPGGPGTPGGPGGGGGVPPGFKPVPPGATVWGDPAGVPAWFDGAGNSFWVSPTCDAVAEGRGFLPLQGNRTAIEEPTLAETLAHAGNSAYGFIDYLLDVEGLTGAGGGASSAAQQIAFRFVQEAAAVCADVPESQWPAPLREWKASFATRIRPWVADYLGGIEFG